MNELIYGAYILVWPVLTLAVLTVICAAVAKDTARARRLNTDIV